MNAHLTSLERPLALHSPARPDSVAAIKASARQEPANPWITFALVAAGTFMIMLDTSIVNISLPSIAQTFHTPVGGAIEWIIIAYLVTIASTLLTFGRLSDMVGRKPVWLSGLALFTLGSGRLWRGKLAVASDRRSRLPRPRWRTPVINQCRDYHRQLFF